MQAPHVFLIRYNHGRRESLLISTIDVHQPYLRIADASLQAGVGNFNPVWRLNRSKISTLRPKCELPLVLTVGIHDPNFDRSTAKVRTEQNALPVPGPTRHDVVTRSCERPSITAVRFIGENGRYISPYDALRAGDPPIVI